MKDQRSGHEFHIIVADAKLQEHPHTDGKRYVVMPSGIGEAPTTYLVDVVEELSHGEVVKHKWPVTPFQVKITNNDAKPCFAEIKVDGKVAHLRSSSPFLKPGESTVLEGFEDSNGKRELLFSLPRHLTLSEKKNVDEGQKGTSRTEKELQELSSIIVTFKPTEAQGERKIHTNAHGGRGGDDNSFKQANKSDTNAKSRGCEVASTATTTLGKRLSGGRSGSSSVGGQREVIEYRYDTTVPETILRLEYRTKWNLQQLGLDSLPAPSSVSSRGSSGAGCSSGGGSSSQVGGSGGGGNSGDSGSGSNKKRKVDGLRAMQKLGTFLAFHSELSGTKELLKRAGVETVADLDILSDGDLQSAGLSVVQIRKLRVALEGSSSSRDNGSESEDDDDTCIDLT
jgi:hypothetical protein